MDSDAPVCECGRRICPPLTTSCTACAHSAVLAVFPLSAWRSQRIRREIHRRQRDALLSFRERGGRAA